MRPCLRPSHRKDTCFDQSFWCNIKVCLFYPGEGFVRSTFLLFFTPPVASILAIGAHLSSLSAHSGGALHRIISSCLGRPLGTPFGRLTRPLRRSFWGGDFAVESISEFCWCTHIEKKNETSKHFLLCTLFSLDQLILSFYFR